MPAHASNLDNQIKSALKGCKANYSASHWHDLEQILIARPQKNPLKWSYSTPKWSLSLPKSLTGISFKENPFKRWSYSVNVIIGIVVLGTVGILVSKNIERKRENSNSPVNAEKEAPKKETPAKSQNIVITPPPETETQPGVDSALPPPEKSKTGTRKSEALTTAKANQETKFVDSTEKTPSLGPPTEEELSEEILIKDVPITAEPPVTAEDKAKKQEEPEKKRSGWKEILRLKKPENTEGK